ncbi:MAG: hypothetical protein DRH08_00190 [Deltaproteobacteria bacterium]|nr:MAG: hypothetical protein DRH08_00190 [Deltaproteobacteria bacterium]
MAPGPKKPVETFVVRLSARTTQSNFDKLMEIAKSRDWINAQGRPNISKVLNYVIESFDAKKAGKRGKR